MPCQGATQSTPEEIDLATDAVLLLLKNEFRVFDMEPLYPLPGFKRGREESKAKLRDAIADLLFQRNCEEF